MQIIKTIANNSIYIVEFSRLQQLTKEFLDYICGQNMAVKRNNYWMINSNLNIYENGDVAVAYINQLLYNTQIRNYSQLMITDR